MIIKNDRVERIIHCIRLRKIRKDFFLSEACELTKDYRSYPFFVNSYYKDETWNYIANFYNYRKSLATSKPLVFEDNECNGERKIKEHNKIMHVQTKPQKENWICFYYKNTLNNNYRLEFDIIIHSVFKEIQIAFNYQNLGNRLRYLIRNNEYLEFECVKDGEFYNHIFQIPLSFQLDQQYHIELIVGEKRSSFIIDGHCVMSVGSKKIEQNANQLCLILYHPDDQSDIRCDIFNAHVDVEEIS